MSSTWAIILGLLTQLASCADRYLEDIEPVPVAQLDQFRHAGEVTGGELVLLSGVNDSRRQRVIARVDRDGIEHPLHLESQSTGRCMGEALVVRETRWWYSRCADSGIQFVTSDAPGSARVIAIRGDTDPRKWIPFEQDEPGGVLLSVERDERTVVATRVTASGIQDTLGGFDRGSSDWGTDRGEAIPLREEGVALITVETISSDPFGSSLVLRVTWEGQIITSPLTFHASGWEAITAVAGPDGMLAIVASPFNRSGIITVLVDPTRPDEASVRPIPDSTGALPDLELLASGAGFIVSWIDETDRAVRLVELDGESIRPAVVVAPRAGGANPALSLQHVADEDFRGLAVFWPDDSGNVMMRRLPDPPTDALIAAELIRAFAKRARHDP